MSLLDSELLPERAAASPSGTWAPGLQSSLLSCVAGSLVGCAIVHAVDPFYKFAQLPELGLSPSPELLKKYHDATLAFWTSNYALDFGLLGLCLGSTIGLFSTRTRRAASSLAGSLGGSVGGIISGYILGIFTAYSIIRSEDQSLVHSATMHFAIWASMIACILFMIGYVQDGLVHSLNYVVIGIVIGLAVAVAYNIVSSIVFSHSNLLKLIPGTGLERLAWILLCSVVLGIGLHFGLRRQHPVISSEGSNLLHF